MPMTKGEVSRRLAEKVGISKRQSDQYLEALAQLAYEQAKNTFTLPGLGKLVLVERPAREATMPFGPRKGEKYTVPAKRVVKFRLAKAAKDAIVGRTAAPASASGKETRLAELLEEQADLYEQEGTASDEEAPASAAPAPEMLADLGGKAGGGGPEV